MKTIYYKIVFILLLFPSIAIGNSINRLDGRYTEEKSLNKELTVHADALLKINNDYGNLDITSWGGDTIKMEITIKVNGNDQEKVIDKLKSIDVLFETSPGMVSAKTIFDKETQSWWGKLTDAWGGSNLKMEINYIIKIPITNSIDLNNDYGSITLDKIQGNAKINCDYGQIIIGELLGDENFINIDYTNNSIIKYMKKGKINADYSSFTLKRVGKLQLIADYTQSKIEYAEELSYNCDYGALLIGDIGILKGNGDYLDIDVKSISEMLILNSDYGSVDVNTLKSTIKEVVIKTDYSGVSLGYAVDFNFSFKVKTSYGSIKMDEDDVVIMKRSEENTSKFYLGYRGDKNAENSIHISTSYGGVKLHKN